MARLQKKPMAHMSLDAHASKPKSEFRKLKPSVSQLETRDVAQPHMFALNDDGDGFVRVPADVVKRLGWEYGAKMFVSELPPGPCFAEKRALLIETE